MVDPSLIPLVKQRQEAACKTMYEQCIAYVYSIVRRYVSNESDHQDVIQEVFARLFLRIETFNSRKGKFKPWLRRLVINQCFQHARKTKQQGRLVPLDAIPVADSSYDPRFSSFSQEELAVYLRTMPAGYRQVFMLVVIDEYSHQEVADLLGIVPATSRTQLLRAKKWLARRIKKVNPKIATTHGK